MCLSIVLIDSIHKIGENYFPQIFFEKIKYLVKQVKTCITDKLEISSDEYDETGLSDEEMKID